MPDASSFAAGAGQIQTLIATLQATNTRLSLLFEALLGGPTVNELLGTGVSLYQAIQKIGGGGILGVSDGSNAAPGFVGEYLSATASSVALTNATPANIVTLSLSAGDWDVWGDANMTASVGATLCQASVSATSATMGSAVPDNASYSAITMATAAITNAVLGLAPCRFSLSAPATAYFVCQASFASGTVSVNAKICARRRR